MNRDNILDNLRLFDKEAKVLIKHSVKPRVIIMGGSAFILMGQTDRATRDIDVLSVPRELGKLLESYEMSLAVNAYADCLPYNYEDRLIPLDMGDTCLEYLAPSLEDLVITKLYGLRDPDIEDITGEAVLVNINWKLLEKLVYDKDEAPASALSERRYKEMVRAFEEYKAEYCDERTDTTGLS